MEIYMHVISLYSKK